MVDENLTDTGKTTLEAPTVAVGTSSFRQQYLLAFAAQPEVRQHLRTQAIKEEAHRLPQVMKAWESAQPKIKALFISEKDIADTISIEDVPEKSAEPIKGLLDNDLLRKSFQLPWSVKVVEIDKLVAAQRTVNLDFIEQSVSDFPKKLTFDSLIKICLSPKQSMAPIEHLELGPNSHIFSSPSRDLRFLGAFVKDLTNDDLAYAQMGGVPAAAIISFIGYGAYPVNVLLHNSRAVLNNGFHRVYALRSKGVQKIPVIVQQAHNLQLEFPQHVAGIPRDYLLGHPRPVLMKDFFENDFTTTLKVRKRIRTVTLQANIGQHDVPS